MERLRHVWHLLPIVVLCLACCWCEQVLGADRETIRIYASKNVANQIQSIASTFMTGRDGLNLTVVGGTPDRVIQHFLNGEADPIIIPRERSDKAISFASNADTCFMPVFSYPVAVVVNANLQVTELSLENLAKIFSGSYKNWKELGGPDLSIAPVKREDTAGTTALLNSGVLKGNNVTADALTVSSDKTLLSAVAQNTGGIGYVRDRGSGHEAVKFLALSRAPGSVAVLPTETNAADGSYPLAIQIAAYWNCRSVKAKLLKQFVEASHTYDWSDK